MAKKYYRPTHKHRCPECGTVWEHNELAAGIQALHVCPRTGCGGRSFMLYEGDEPVAERTIVTRKRREELIEAEGGEPDF